MHQKFSFGSALRRFRLAKGLTQEDFSLVSSRTYISALERGLKSPTLEKVELIGKKLDVSPLTLLFAAYTSDMSHDEVLEQLESLKKDLDDFYTKSSV